jgi:hypothetical protein
MTRFEVYMYRFGRLSWRHTGASLTDYTVEFTSVLAWYVLCRNCVLWLSVVLYVGNQHMERIIAFAFLNHCHIIFVTGVVPFLELLILEM